MYKELIEEAQGHKFAPFWSFDDDNEHVAALVHSQVQDVMWLDTAVEEIANIHEQPNSDLVTAHSLDKYDLVLHVIRAHSHEKKRCPDFQSTTSGDRTSANRALQESEEQ